MKYQTADKTNQYTPSHTPGSSFYALCCC